METIAVYWEPVIRVYGFDTRENVAMLAIDTLLEQCDFLATSIESFNGDPCKYLMVLSQLITPDKIRFHLVINSDSAIRCKTHFESILANAKETNIILSDPVDVLFFHGPHFQDRYGIAETAFTSLDMDQVDLLLTGCTGTSIYMVVKAGQAQLTKQMLTKNFTVPGTDS